MGNRITLKSVDSFIIKDEFGAEYYGGSEVWFAEKKHKEVANGAAVLATMFSYFERSWSYFDGLCSHNPKKKNSFIEYMYDVLKYVSPGLIGIMAGDLRKGAKQYSESRGFVFRSEEFTIPGAKVNRPEDRAIFSYIENSLRRDIPVGFINLGSGRVKNITPNHWVIIVGMEKDTGMLDVLDNGKLIAIDLEKWLKKSSMGGSFAIIEPEYED